LGAWAADSAFQGVRVTLGALEVAPPAQPVGVADCAAGQTFAAEPFAACLIAPPPQDIPSGDTLPVSILWSSAQPPGGNYDVRWRLTNATRAVVLEQIDPLSPHPTSHWRADDSFESRYSLSIDPALPAGEYGLVFNVLDPEGAPVRAYDAPLATVEVLHRERRFDLPDDITHPLDLTLGDAVHLRGFDLSSGEASPGGTLSLTLYWQGDAPTDIDYTVFVHLVGPDGQNHGQLDYQPGGGSTPTTSWAPGQVVIDDLALPVDGGAPAGTYMIAVGMYDAASGGRLPMVDASGNRLPGDRAILPVEIVIGN
jgi:hypothetical protein